MKRNRIALVGATLAVTAAVAYAQLGSYSQLQLSRTPAGQALLQTIGGLNSLYLTEPDQEKLLRGAIKGALGSLDDEYTYYQDPENNALDTQRLAGEFFGIGVTLGPANSDGTGGRVDTVYKGGAAFGAGVQSGDVFVKIGDTDVEQSDLNKIVSLVRGAKGTNVVITFSREGKPYTVTMERQPVTIVDVEKTVLPGGVGYIALNSFFNEKVFDQFRAAIADMKKQNVSKLILDLRDNGGGLLTAGVDVADQFMQSGPIVSLRDRSQRAEVYGRASPAATDYTGQLIVLVNKNSASASEVVTGALQDVKRATVIGEQTRGKGVAQSPIPLADGGRVNIVSSEWLTPNGRQIHKKGIAPDIVVEDTRFPIPLNVSGAGLKPGQEATFTVGGQTVKVTGDKDGKFTYTAPIKRTVRSDVQGQATVDLPNDAILRKALESFK